MSALFSKPKKPPSLEDAEVREAKRKELVAAALRKGRTASILTGGQGAQGQASISRPTLVS